MPSLAKSLGTVPSLDDMDMQFVAGFGPITRDPAGSRQFWADAIGIQMEQVSSDYFHTHDLPGTKAFAVWSLEQAARSVFGKPEWPEHFPVPQAWIEFEVGSVEAVGEAVDELRGKGELVLAGPQTEPWGQTTARLLSPEGLLVGVSYLPSFHEQD